MYVSKKDKLQIQLSGQSERNKNKYSKRQFQEEITNEKNKNKVMTIYNKQTKKCIQI